PQELVQTSINGVNVMQIATCAGDKPYVVNVHYYADEAGNLYWISTPERRHSLELAANPNACVVIKIHENTAEEDWVIGVSIEGIVEYVGEDPGQDVALAFQQKLGKNPQLLEDIKTGSNPHKFYRLVPHAY